jgi:hypothetical protein
VWEGRVYPEGTTRMSFSLTASGTLSVTLTDVEPTAVALGVGLGVPTNRGRGCDVTAQVETTAGSRPQMTSAAEAGNHCLVVFDVGQVGLSGAPFTVSLRAQAGGRSAHSRRRDERAWLRIAASVRRRHEDSRAARSRRLVS